MKKNVLLKKVLYLLPQVLLIFLSATIFVAGWMAATEAYDLSRYYIVFAISIILNLAYLRWITTKKEIIGKKIILSLPIVLPILFIFFVYNWVNPIYNQ